MFTLFFIILFLIVLAFLAIKIMQTLQARGSVLKVLMLIIVFATLFTVSSTSWTRDTTYNVAIVKPLEYGWPISFYFLDHPMKEVWQAPMVVWSNFFVSVSINASLWGGIFFLLAVSLRKRKVVIKPSSFKYFLMTLVIFILIMIVSIFVSKAIRVWKYPGMENPVTLPVNFSNPSYDAVQNSTNIKL